MDDSVDMNSTLCNDDNVFCIKNKHFKCVYFVIIVAHLLDNTQTKSQWQMCTFTLMVHTVGLIHSFDTFLSS